MANNTTNSTTLSTTLSTITTTLLNTTTNAVTTVITTTTSKLTSSLVTTAMTSSSSSISPNSSTDGPCSQNFSVGTCRFADFIRVLAYILLGVSLIPQILYSFQHGSRYIAGISYMWIIIRVLGLTSLLVAHAFKWTFFFELIAIISTIIMLIQILYFADNFHRQEKIVLIGVSLGVWMVGGGIILLTRKYVKFLIMTGYILLSVHMLPQVCQSEESPRINIDYFLFRSY